MGGPVSDTGAMIAGMAPEAVPGAVAFVSVAEAGPVLADARAMVREAEGVTLILPADHPVVPTEAMRMIQITLKVHSALDGVGLTAAVADALAAEAIPCNVVAGFYHDHLYVPEAQAERAVALLRTRAEAAR